MKFNTAVRKKIITNLNNSKSGVECIFVPIDKKIGVKLYSNLNARDYAYKLQKEFLIYSYAPEIGDKFTLKNYRVYHVYADTRIVEDIGKECFGYLTQIANFPQFYSDRFYNQLDKLCESMEILGYDPIDIHEENVGYINRKLVVIDFGPETHNV